MKTSTGRPASGHLILILFAFGFLFYHQPPCRAQEITKTPAPPAGFIWKSTIDQATFYLVGSVHAGKETYYPLPEQYLGCYTDADVMIMELEDDLATLEEKMIDYAEKDRLPEEQYFRHHLDSTTLEKILGVLELEEFQKYDQYKGWFLNMILSGTKHRLYGFHGDHGVDMYFRNMAKEDNKQVIGLDRFEDQFELFEFDVPYEAQIQVIQRAAGALQMQATAELPLLEAYYSQDPDRFGKVFASMYDFTNPVVKDVYEQVFTARNKKWVNHLEEIARDKGKTYMVLVGAGHFFGPDNVRELLKSRGYQVESL